MLGLVILRGGRWDFRFCGFGQFLVRFFGFIFALKNWFFGFIVLRGLRVFSNLVFSFRFLSTMMAVFRIFPAVQCIYGFSGSAKEITPCSRPKTVIPKATYIAFRIFYFSTFQLITLSLREVDDKPRARSFGINPE